MLLQLSGKQMCLCSAGLGVCRVWVGTLLGKQGSAEPPQPSRVHPLSPDSLCSPQVFTTPAQQPVATPLMTPSYSYTTPSQPITTPQYQLQANTTPQSTQSQAQSQPSSSSRQRQQPK